MVTVGKDFCINFINDIATGIERTLSKFTNDNKFISAVDTPRGGIPSRGTWTSLSSEPMGVSRG